MSAPMRRLARRAGGLLLMALLSCAQLAPIGALWLGDDACCGCTSSLCCRSPRSATPPPPPTAKSCHDEERWRDGAALTCAPPSTDIALPFVARGILPVFASLQNPARSGAATPPTLRAPLVGSVRIDLPPPRHQLLVS